MNSVIVWDLETVPDLRGFAAANDLGDKSDDEIREALGDKFPKHVYHSIACIGALIAYRKDGHWEVDALGAPHVWERSEKELITSFVDKIEELTPQLVTFNGNSFDLPVLRYRDVFPQDITRAIDELVPCLAAVIDEIVVGFEDTIGEPVVAHELPDVLDRV